MEVLKEITRPDPALVHRAAGFSSATLHEAMGKRGALSYAIKPIFPEMKLCGPVVTVSSPPVDNLTIHKAIYEAKKGDVLLVVVGGVYEAGYWGEIMATAAQERGIAGLVIDGCVRDADLIHQMRFPIFSRGLSIRGTNKRGGGTINAPLLMDGTAVHPGDVIVGDRDGLVVLPAGEIGEILDEAQKREEKEERIVKELKAGKSTLEIYGWR
jgi:4-hydroxy-4-methyl-2-oxoglutarate aldolase